MNDFSKYIKIFATYSEVFDKRFDKDSLIEGIPKLHLGGLLNILSQITFVNLNNSFIKQLFYDYFSESEIIRPRKILKRRLNRIDNYILYTPQGLLSEWKWLLAYGDKDKLTEEININHGIFKVIYFCLIVSDYLFEEESKSIKYETVRNKAFNINENPKASVARSKHIYIDLAKNKKLFNAKEYVDFNSKFENTYGYSLEDHFAVIFGIIVAFYKKDNIINGNWAKNFNEYFSKTNLSELALDIVDSMTAEFDDLSEWSKDNIENPWSFIMFRKKPLFKIDENKIIPISYKFLIEQLFEGVFYKIRACYSSKDLSFNRFFGKPYEKYLEKLMIKAEESSGQKKYELIKEFKYDSGEKKSPDVMLKLGDKLLVIESKSKRLPLEALEGSDQSSIDKAQKDLVLSPIKQAHDRIIEIKNSDKQHLFEEIEEFYLLVVNIRDFPTLPPIEKEFQVELEKYFNISIKGFFHMDIQEYEMLCYLISRNTKSSIFSILDNKYNKHFGIPFSNFLDMSSLPLKNPEFVDEKAEEFFNIAKNKLFKDN